MLNDFLFTWELIAVGRSRKLCVAGCLSEVWRTTAEIRFACGTKVYLATVGRACPDYRARSAVEYTDG
jgi:hypothetical protein